MDYSPWSEREIWPFLKVAVPPKPEKSCPPKSVHMHVTSIPTCMNFLADSDQLNFLTTMDYNPWSEREIWPFLKVAVPPKPEKSCPPKSVHMHVTSIPTCMNFFSRFQSIKFFDDHGLYSPWSEREIWPFLKVAVCLKSEKSCPPKSVHMHVTPIPTCMIFLSKF